MRKVYQTESERIEADLQRIREMDAYWKTLTYEQQHEWRVIALAKYGESDWRLTHNAKAIAFEASKNDN
jgi:hypothetical protein